MARQMPLFGPPLNVTSRLKASMREAIKNCRFSRDQVVDRMKALASVEGLGGGRGSTISLANLDAWCSESHPNLIPINLLTIFCHVVGDITPISTLAAPLSGQVIQGRKIRLLIWAENEIQFRDLSKKRKKILSEIEGGPDD